MVDDGVIPLHGTIRHVRGRHAKDAERGLPKVSEIVIEHGDGRRISATALPTGPRVRRDTAVGVCEIGPGQFEFCPICYHGPADSQEHVPPKGFGGRIMATTCQRCNNTFGSRTEAAMQDWYDHAVRVHYTVDGDPRPFGHTRALVLSTSEQEFVLFPQRGSDPGETFSKRMQEQASVLMHYTPPRPAEYRNGMLKSAYLAASLHLGGVPNVPSAAEIRSELHAVVNARSRSEVPLGPHGRKLRFYRTGEPAGAPNLALMRGTQAAGQPEYLISLAGTVLAGWPFPEIDPTRTRRPDFT